MYPLIPVTGQLCSPHFSLRIGHSMDDLQTCWRAAPVNLGRSGSVAALLLLCVAVGSANAQGSGMRARAPGMRGTLAAGALLIEISKPDAGYTLTCEPATCRVDPKIRFSKTNLSLLRYQAVSIKLGVCDDTSGCRSSRGSLITWTVPYPEETDLAQIGLTSPGTFRLLWEINNRPGAAYSDPLTFHDGSPASIRK